jgi:hypothetical protein
MHNLSSYINNAFLASFPCLNDMQKKKKMLQCEIAPFWGREEIKRRRWICNKNYR